MTVKALLIHDHPVFAKPVARNIELKNQVPTQAIRTFSEAEEFIKQGKLMNVDCAIIHKDLGQYSGEGDGLVDQLVQQIHETNETIRIGIVSGEYPDGRKHVLELGADFYLSTDGIRRHRDWLVEQIKRGPVLPDEIGKRNKEVITPTALWRSPERE